MKINPDKYVLEEDYITKKIQNILRKIAIALVFGVIYFFFIKLLFL